MPIVFKSFVIPALLGVTGVVAAGSYGLSSHLDKKVESKRDLGIVYSREGMREEIPSIEEKQQELISVEYILKGKSWEDPNSCLKKINGKEEFMSKSYCDKIIDQKWRGNYKEQPDMWLRIKEGEVVETLLSFFNGNNTKENAFLIDKERFEKESWDAFSLSCKKSSAENGKVEVSCYHKENVTRR
ncbi:putative coniferaldehyde-5-hydroxylase [Mycoplasma suis KI3806]|uniref:Coniferaldehyde-5-hydroxylase n=1 Tax=Mycoplasma suis (strain KI_3806) TaxID=708248 RepID=F0V333_MYCS3|nr:hypothetical protein [Mycoplasma suis]CBZ40255.1 putative coniferaldehyde-5-hydroxylase [Mycoplasma suis KI3806]